MSSILRTLPATTDSAESEGFSLTRKEEAAQNQVPGSDATLVRLFCVWVLLQCFSYEALPSFRWGVGITFSPDRLVFCVILFAYAKRAAHSRAYARPGTMAAKMLELFM